ERPNGNVLAILISYACHPVVLSAKNKLLSADYPGVVREQLEAATGATVLFATSCAGDVNTGHDISGERSDLRSYPRTFAQCDVVGGRIASAALKANLEGGTQFIGAVSDSITIPLESSSPERLQQESCQAVDLKSSGDSSRLVPPESEVRPAESSATDSRIEWKARITVFHWGPAVIVT